jgi:hypothetical protein
MSIDITGPDSERLDLLLLISLAAAKFLVHFGVNAAGAYGFFRDEFYYIACSDRLAFGYVDHPPLSILLLKTSRMLFGDSLVAVRLFPALAGALTLFLTGLIVKELGGKRFAMVFAALCVLMAPLHLGINSYYSMNSFDILTWTAAAYILVMWVHWQDPGMWIWLGVLLGLGLQNKISVLWLGFGLTLGLLLTENRRSFMTRGPWLAGGIALLIFLPHIIWQVSNGWPTLQFMAGATGKMLKISFLRYLGSQIMDMHPLLFPVWFAGLVWYLFARQGEHYRVLGIIYVSVFALLVISGSARSSYLAPAYPMLFASGALVLEKASESVSGAPLMRYVRGALVAIILAGGIAIAPLALPVLPVRTYIEYSAALGNEPATDEKNEMGALPQFFADMHGWEEIVDAVAGVFESAKVDDPGKWAVLTANYGEAGAIDFLGRERDLPPAISGHNNYWLWGPGDPPPENLIILGGRLEDYGICREVWQAGTADCTYCMPYEDNNPIFVCMGLQVDPTVIWSEVKHFQ